MPAAEEADGTDPTVNGNTLQIVRILPKRVSLVTSKFLGQVECLRKRGIDEAEIKTRFQSVVNDGEFAKFWHAIFSSEGQNSAETRTKVESYLIAPSGGLLEAMCQALDIDSAEEEDDEDELALVASNVEKLQANLEALREEHGDLEVATVSVMGKYRSGKSTFLSLALRYVKYLQDLAAGTVPQKEFRADLAQDVREQSALPLQNPGRLFPWLEIQDEAYQKVWEMLVYQKARKEGAMPRSCELCGTVQPRYVGQSPKKVMAYKLCSDRAKLKNLVLQDQGLTVDRLVHEQFLSDDIFKRLAGKTVQEVDSKLLCWVVEADVMIFEAPWESVIAEVKYEHDADASSENEEWFAATTLESHKLDNKNGFSYAAGDATHTKGIWLWQHPFVLRNAETGQKTALLLVDTQGQDDGVGERKISNLLYLLTGALSSTLVVNQQLRLDDELVRQMDVLATLGQAAFSVNRWGKLLFMLRDRMDADSEDSRRAHQEQFLASGKVFADRLREVFTSVDLRALPTPGSSVMSGKWGGDLRKMDSGFLMHVTNLLDRIIGAPFAGMYEGVFPHSDLLGQERLISAPFGEKVTTSTLLQTLSQLVTCSSKSLEDKALRGLQNGNFERGMARREVQQDTVHRIAQEVHDMTISSFMSQDANLAVDVTGQLFGDEPKTAAELVLARIDSKLRSLVHENFSVEGESRSWGGETWWRVVTPEERAAIEADIREKCVTRLVEQCLEANERTKQATRGRLLVYGGLGAVGVTVGSLPLIGALVPLHGMILLGVPGFLRLRREYSDNIRKQRLDGREQAKAVGNEEDADGLQRYLLEAVEADAAAEANMAPEEQLVHEKDQASDAEVDHLLASMAALSAVVQGGWVQGKNMAKLAAVKAKQLTDAYAADPEVATEIDAALLGEASNPEARASSVQEAALQIAQGLLGSDHDIPADVEPSFQEALRADPTVNGGTVQLVRIVPRRVYLATKVLLFRSRARALQKFRELGIGTQTEQPMLRRQFWNFANYSIQEYSKGDSNPVTLKMKARALHTRFCTELCKPMYSSLVVALSSLGREGGDDFVEDGDNAEEAEEAQHVESEDADDFLELVFTNVDKLQERLENLKKEHRCDDMPVAIVSVIGQYRSGKSTLLSLALRYAKFYEAKNQATYRRDGGQEMKFRQLFKEQADRDQNIRNELLQHTTVQGKHIYNPGKFPWLQINDYEFQRLWKDHVVDSRRDGIKCWKCGDGQWSAKENVVEGLDASVEHLILLKIALPSQPAAALLTRVQKGEAVSLSEVRMHFQGTGIFPEKAKDLYKELNGKKCWKELNSDRFLVYYKNTAKDAVFTFSIPKEYCIAKERQGPGSDAEWLEQSKVDAHTLGSAFSWASGDVTHTKGIWIWSEPFVMENEGKQVAVLLMDTQGQNDGEGERRVTNLMPLLASALSATLVVNQPIRMDEKLVKRMDVLATLSKAAVAESSARTGQASRRKLGKLLFLVRDKLDAKDAYYMDRLEYEDTVRAPQWRQFVTTESATNQDISVAKRLARTYAEVDMQALPGPGLTVKSQGWDGDLRYVDSTFLLHATHLFDTTIGRWVGLGTDNAIANPYGVEDWIDELSVLTSQPTVFGFFRGTDSGGIHFVREEKTAQILDVMGTTQDQERITSVQLRWYDEQKKTVHSRDVPREELLEALSVDKPRYRGMAGEDPANLTPIWWTRKGRDTQPSKESLIPSYAGSKPLDASNFRSVLEKMLRDFRRSLNDVHLGALHSGTFDLEFATLHAQQIEIRRLGLVLHDAMRERFGQRDAELVTHSFDEEGEIDQTPEQQIRAEMKIRLHELVAEMFVLQGSADADRLDDEESWWRVISKQRLCRIEQEMNESVGSTLLRQCVAWNNRIRAETIQQIQKYGLGLAGASALGSLTGADLGAGVLLLAPAITRIVRETREYKSHEDHGHEGIPEEAGEGDELLLELPEVQEDAQDEAQKNEGSMSIAGAVSHAVAKVTKGGMQISKNIARFIVEYQKLNKWHVEESADFEAANRGSSAASSDPDVAGRWAAEVTGQLAGQLAGRAAEAVSRI